MKLYIFYLYVVNLIKQIFILINFKAKEETQYVKSPTEVYIEKH